MSINIAYVIYLYDFILVYVWELGKTEKNPNTKIECKRQKQHREAKHKTQREQDRQTAQRESPTQSVGQTEIALLKWFSIMIHSL